MLDLFTWMLVFTRASAFFLVFPLFAAANIPARIRVVIGAFVALLVAPQLTNPIDPAQLHIPGLVLLLAKEVGVGILLGSTIRLIFYALQLSGHFISTEIGLQTSTILTPTDAVPVEVPGAVLNLLGMMLFLSMDMHHAMMIAFQQSYSVLPIGSGGMSNALFEDLTMRTSRVVLLSVQIASPLIAVGFLVGLILMMLGRAVPQMNIFFESFTIRLLAGLVVFGFSLDLAAQRISDFFHSLPEDLLDVSRLLGVG